MKRTALAIWLLIALALTGCAPLPFVPVDQGDIAQLPTPAPFAGEAPIGDSRKERTERVNIYYLSPDEQSLTVMARTITVSGDESKAVKVMERLLEPPDWQAVKAIAPAGTRLLQMDVAGGVATVNLSADARNMGAEEQLRMRAAITNTLTQLDGVRYVNVLIGNQVESLNADLLIPVGLLTQSDQPLSTLWAQAQADAQRFESAQTARKLETTAALYFPSSEGGRLLCEPRKIQLALDDLVMPLLRELALGPSDLGEAVGVLPDDIDPLQASPSIETSADGRKLIVLPFADQFTREMRERGASMRQLYGALTLTLCRFIPEVDGVQIKIGGKLITHFEGMGPAANPPGGVLMPKDFAPMIGDIAQVYFATANDRLESVKRTLDPLDVASPRALIELLIQGPREGEHLMAVMPEGVESSDLLGARTEGDCVVLNWSSNFYRCSQQLTEPQERCLIYAIVNSLTSVPNIARVRFLVDGASTDDLAHSIYLREPLIRNPGIIEG